VQLAVSFQHSLDFLETRVDFEWGIRQWSVCFLVVVDQDAWILEDMSGENSDDAVTFADYSVSCATESSAKATASSLFSPDTS